MRGILLIENVAFHVKIIWRGSAGEDVNSFDRSERVRVNRERYAIDASCENGSCGKLSNKAPSVSQLRPVVIERTDQHDCCHQGRQVRAMRDALKWRRRRKVAGDKPHMKYLWSGEARKPWMRIEINKQTGT